MATCPYCETALTNLKIQGLNGNGPGGIKWNCVAYSCPSCDKALSVGLDPIALKADTVNETAKKVRGG